MRRFQATKPWTLSWRFDCTGLSGQSELSQFQIFANVTDPNVTLNAVNEITERGSGTEHYSATGGVYLIANTQCAWALRAS